MHYLGHDIELFSQYFVVVFERKADNVNTGRILKNKIDEEEDYIIIDYFEVQ